MTLSNLCQAPLKITASWGRAGTQTVANLKHPMAGQWIPQTFKAAAGHDLELRNRKKELILVNGALIRSLVDVAAFAFGLIQDLGPIAKASSFLQGKLPPGPQTWVPLTLASPNTVACYAAARGMKYVAGELATLIKTARTIQDIAPKRLLGLAVVLTAVPTLLYHAHEYQKLPSLARFLADGCSYTKKRVVSLKTTVGAHIRASRHAAAERLEQYNAWQERHDELETLLERRTTLEKAKAAWVNAKKPDSGEVCDAASAAEEAYRELGGVFQTNGEPELSEDGIRDLILQWDSNPVRHPGIIAQIPFWATKDLSL